VRASVCRAGKGIVVGKVHRRNYQGDRRTLQQGLPLSTCCSLHHPMPHSLAVNRVSRQLPQRHACCGFWLLWSWRVVRSMKHWFEVLVVVRESNVPTARYAPAPLLTLAHAPLQGNDVFSCMLGKPMVYTCGIFHEMPKFASDDHKVSARSHPPPPTLQSPPLTSRLAQTCEGACLVSAKGPRCAILGCCCCVRLVAHLIQGSGLQCYKCGAGQLCCVGVRRSPRGGAAQRAPDDLRQTDAAGGRVLP